MYTYILFPLCLATILKKGTTFFYLIPFDLPTRQMPDQYQAYKNIQVVFLKIAKPKRIGAILNWNLFQSVVTDAPRFHGKMTLFQRQILIYDVVCYNAVLSV